jgi:protein AroM
MGMLGVVTIGQAPRTDLVPDFLHLFGDIAIQQRGALDDLDEKAIRALKPEAGERVLSTLLRNGSSALVSHEQVAPLVQATVDQLERDGASAILLACTDTFKDLHSNRQLFLPEGLFTHAVTAMATGHRVGVMCPAEEQIPAVREQWEAHLGPVDVEAVSPYDFSPEVFASAGQRLASRGCSLIAMDCMAYSVAMKTAVRDSTGLPVLLSRTITARLAAEFLDV